MTAKYRSCHFSLSSYYLKFGPELAVGILGGIQRLVSDEPTSALIIRVSERFKVQGSR
jgi:hypothetical protein